MPTNISDGQLTGLADFVFVNSTRLLHVATQAVRSAGLQDAEENALIAAWDEDELLALVLDRRLKQERLEVSPEDQARVIPTIRRAEKILAEDQQRYRAQLAAGVDPDEVEPVRSWAKCLEAAIG